jgi:thiamine pyrophosphokinase
MRWPEFLDTIQQAKAVTLVGPLFGNEDGFHSPRSPTIYVDGGARFRPARSEFPAVSVGDGDSSAGVALDELLPAGKDFSDLAFALRGLPGAVCEIEMLGFLGGRRDHELAVLGEVHAFSLGRKLVARLFDTEGRLAVVVVSGSPFTFELHGTFSVFSTLEAEVTITGACRYPLANPTKLTALSSHGLSNEANGYVTVAGDQPLFIYIN